MPEPSAEEREAAIAKARARLKNHKAKKSKASKAESTPTHELAVDSTVDDGEHSSARTSVDLVRADSEAGSLVDTSSPVIPTTEIRPSTPSLASQPVSIAHPSTDAVSTDHHSIDLSALVASQQQTIALLVAEKSTLTTQLDAAEEKLSNLEDQLEGTSKNVHELDALRIRLTEVEDSLTVSRRAKEELEARAIDGASRIAALEREASLQTHERETLQSSLDTKVEELARLEETLNSGSTSAKDQVDDLEKRLRAKATHADSLESELSKSKSTMSKLSSEKDDLQKKHDSALEQLAKANADLQSTSTEISTHKARLDSLTVEHSSANDKTAKLQASHESLLSEKNSLQSNCETLKADYATATSSLTSVQSRLEEVEALLETATTRRDALQEENEELMTDLSELREKVVGLTDTNVTQQEKLDILSRSIREKESELVKLRSELDQQTTSLNVSQENVKAKEKSISDLKERLERAEREAEYAADDAKTREVEIDSLRKKLGDLDVQVSSLRQVVDSKTQEIKELEGSIRSERLLLETEQNAAATSKVQIQQQKDLAESLRTELEEARHQLALAKASAAASLLPSLTPAPVTPIVLSPLKAQSSLPNGIAKNSVDKAEEVHQLRDLLLESQQQNEVGTKQVLDLRKQVESLNALILIERDKVMKAMAEVFNMNAAPPSLSPGARQPSLSPAAALPVARSISPTPRTSSISPSPSPSKKPVLAPIARRPSSFVHRRSASHLPTLDENLTAEQRAELEAPKPLPQITLPPAQRSIPQKPNLPPATRHARRQSLTMLKTRMEDELGLPDLMANGPSPTSMNYTSLPAQLAVSPGADSHGHRRPSAKLGHDFIWCAHCTNDLLVI